MADIQETYRGYLTSFEQKLKSRVAFVAAVSAFTLYGMAWGSFAERTNDTIEPTTEEPEHVYFIPEQEDYVSEDSQIPTGKIGFVAGIVVGAAVTRRFSNGVQ